MNHSLRDSQQSTSGFTEIDLSEEAEPYLICMPLRTLADVSTGCRLGQTTRRRQDFLMVDC